MKKVISISVLLIILTCTSCATRRSAAVTGGLTGAAAGAGIGAGVGALISNGDIGQSALLGAGIGLPVGIAAGLAYKHYVYDKPVRENNKIIEENYDLIQKRKQEIQDTREQMLNESYLVNPDTSLREDLYLGPTIGKSL